MYMLRAISAVLHQDVGPAVPDSALDLRQGELAVVVPLVLCLIGLSAYPNLISGHAFGENRAFVEFTQATNTLGPGSCAGSLTDGSCQTVLVKSTSSSEHALNVDPSVNTLDAVAK
jgi:hypothetical protein